MNVNLLRLALLNIWRTSYHHNLLYPDAKRDAREHRHDPVGIGAGCPTLTSGVHQLMHTLWKPLRPGGGTWNLPARTVISHGRVPQHKLRGAVCILRSLTTSPADLWLGEGCGRTRVRWSLLGLHQWRLLQGSGEEGEHKIMKTDQVLEPVPRLQCSCDKSLGLY